MAAGSVRPCESGVKRPMRNIIYLIGLVVVIVAILSLAGIL